MTALWRRTAERSAVRLCCTAVWCGLLLLLACACRSAAQEERTVRITIADGPGYTVSESCLQVARGADAAVTLRFLDGYRFRSCSYGDYDTREGPEGTELTLQNIRYPAFITVETESEAESIYFDLNGGAFLDGSGEDHRIVSCSGGTHLRSNTEIGVDAVAREGYTLLGWNTRPDGSGTHIGLGSRVTCGEEMLLLYAEWAPWEEEGSFTWEAAPEGAVLTAYTGQRETEQLVIPQRIGGCEVVGLAEGFCRQTTAERLVLPHTVRTVAPGAFEDCRFSELYFFDTLLEVTDESFSRSEFITLHINAAVPPRYQSDNELAWFSDMMDRLILASEEKKLILFGGCSLSYGLDSAMIDRHLEGEYRVLNMGIIGGTNAVFQLECITRFMGEGDILIHAPEVGSGYQLYYVQAAESRMFVMTEGNYDLLSYVDMRRVPGVLKAFSAYNAGRRELAEGSYSECSEAYNEYGDIRRLRQGGVDRSYSQGYGYALDFLTEPTLRDLCQAYQRILDRGAQVFFSFSPVNQSALTEEELSGRVWERFEAVIRQTLEDAGIPVISRAEDYLLPGRYFYDTDYHLTTEGAALRTQQLLLDLDARRLSG